MKTHLLLATLCLSMVASAATLGERNNNPGNLKKPPGDVWKGTTGYDKRGHAVFSSLDYGIRALYINFYNRAKRCPDMTLKHYFSRVYAEKNGENEARYIADKLGIGVETKLRDVDLAGLVQCVAWFESRMSIDREQIDRVIEQTKKEKE